MSDGAPGPSPAAAPVRVGVIADTHGLLDLDPAAAGFDVVVYGHSHRPSQERRDGVLYLNPGSAGPRRFSLPVTLAILEEDGKEPRSCLMTLV